MKTKKRYLSALVGLGLGYAATATADGRKWTDVSGKHSVEAEFLAIEGDSVTLKTTAGKVTTFPLANLSEADREIAKKLAAVPEDAPAGDPAAGGEMTVTAKARVREFVNVKDGVQTSTKRLAVYVDLIGGDAAAAFSAGPAVAEPAMVGGKALEFEEGFGSDRFKPIDREEERFLADHPKGGVRAELQFGALPEGSKTVDLVKGKIPVLTGGEPKTVELKDVAARAAGPVEDPALAAAGLKLSFELHDEGDSISLQLTMPEDSKSFEKFEVIGADGKPVKTVGSGSGSFNDIISRSISVPKEALGGASMRIHIRVGAKEVELPFEVTGVTIGG